MFAVGGKLKSVVVVLPVFTPLVCLPPKVQPCLKPPAVNNGYEL